MTISDTSAISADSVLAEVGEMLRTVLDEAGMDAPDITMATSFHDDLELESIDLVALAGLLVQRYGERVNLAEFLAEMSLDEVIGLRVGQVVEFVRERLPAAGE